MLNWQPYRQVMPVVTCQPLFLIVQVMKLLGNLGQSCWSAQVPVRDRMLTSLSTSDFLVMQSNQLHLVRCALLLLCDEIILRSIALMQVNSVWRSEVKWQKLRPVWPVTMTIHVIDKSLCICGRYENAVRPTGYTHYMSQSLTAEHCGKYGITHVLF